MDLLRELQEVDGNCTLDCCSMYEDDLCGSDANAWIAAIPFSLQIILVVVLIMVSALFSGLTLGLMSLDKSGLEIIMSGDDPEAARYAKTIYPLRKDGNLLLCTLVLGNVAVNALLSILMAEYAGGLVGMLSSTFLIVIFGEITPQAAVSFSVCHSCGPRF
jgi:metal transporter CNNM